MASDSRGNEKRFLYHFWDWFPIFKPVSEYAKSERFDLASGFLLRRAVAHHTGERRNFGNPSAVVFLLKLNFQSCHVHTLTQRERL